MILLDRMPESWLGKSRERYIQEIAWASDHLQIGLRPDMTWDEVLAVLGSVDTLSYNKAMQEFARPLLSLAPIPQTWRWVDDSATATLI